MREKSPAPKRRQAKPLSGWHPEDVKAAIRKKGLTLAALSKKSGYSESYLRGTLIRNRPHGEAIIAGFLGVHPGEIWPDRYARVRKSKNGRARKRKG